MRTEIELSVPDRRIIGRESDRTAADPDFAIASLLAMLALVTLVFKTILEYRFGAELAGTRRH